MASFASTFGPSDEGQVFSNNNTADSTKKPNDHQTSNNFSSVDLDQQLSSAKDYRSPYISLSDAATFQPDSSSMTSSIPNSPSRNPVFSSQELHSSKMKFFAIYLKFISNLITLRSKFFFEYNKDWQSEFN